MAHNAKNSISSWGWQHRVEALEAELERVKKEKVDDYLGLKDQLRECRQREDRLREAVNETCGCGGLGPEEQGVCDACRIWHAVWQGKYGAENGVDSGK